MDFSWSQLKELDGEFGDSFFVVDLEAFDVNYREFTAAFRAWYPKTTIGYSYKTNYVPRLCALVQAAGGYAEVVSGMEYQLARRVGVPADRIIFNGPSKGSRDLEEALLSGSICNLDSAHEVEMVEQVAVRAPDAQLAVGLRCNFDIGSDRVSRFGFDVEGPPFREALDALSRLPNCELVGLHFHSSTGHRRIESYSLRTKRMLELSTMCFPDAPPRFINLGGGYFSKMDDALRAQFTDPVPSYADYAEAVAAEVAAFYGRLDGPELIVEPGTAITADVMAFVARVVGVKQVRSRAVALVAGSIHNIKPTLHDKAVPMTVVGADRDEPTERPAEIDIVGYTCMEHDVLAERYPGRVGVGDYVMFTNVGAYTIVMKPPFIRPSPPVVGYDRGAERFELLRRAETADDVFATYVF
jgi:diaminopimelate decarboxylase